MQKAVSFPTTKGLNRFAIGYGQHFACKIMTELVQARICILGYSRFSGGESISFIIPAVIMLAGRAIIAMPKNEDIIVIILPTVETGYISPYPIVVRDTVAQ